MEICGIIITCDIVLALDLDNFLLVGLANNHMYCDAFRLSGDREIDDGPLERFAEYIEMITHPITIRNIKLLGE